MMEASRLGCLCNRVPPKKMGVNGEAGKFSEENSREGPAGLLAAAPPGQVPGVSHSRGGCGHLVDSDP